MSRPPSSPGGSGGAARAYRPHDSPMEQHAEGYLAELSSERSRVGPDFQHAPRLLDKELQRVKDGEKEKPKPVLIDIHKGRPIRVQVRVLVPVKDHPNFNFVGKLLGPKGNSFKRLQEDTRTKMAILGRGSMRDKEKEEELRKQGDPKHSHLNDELHVEVTAFAPAAEAYARITRALVEIKRFLVPDYYDDIRQHQLQELAILNGGGERFHKSRGLTAARSLLYRLPASRHRAEDSSLAQIEKAEAADYDDLYEDSFPLSVSSDVVKYRANGFPDNGHTDTSTFIDEDWPLRSRLKCRARAARVHPYPCP